MINETGTIAFSEERITWEAINQFSKESFYVSLPKMALGYSQFDQNSYPNTPAPLVDQVTEIFGGKRTILQRMND